MKFSIFSIYDNKAETFNTPMYVPAKGVAIRAFSDQANDPQSMLNKHPQDYELFCIGDFDADIGLLTPMTPQSIGPAADFIKPTE